MERSALAVLLTPEGLRLVDGVGEVGSTADVAGLVTRLRRDGHSPDLVSAVISQARLRTRAVAKFGPFAQRMLFTRAGLEQATRLEVAALHAARFRDAGLARVADLGCGIGGDAMAFAGIGLEVTAVDADEVTAAVAAYNLAPFGDTVRVRHDTAEGTDLGDRDAVWLDPARRAAGHDGTTRLRPEDWSPPLTWAFPLLARLPGGMKLGPAFGRDEVPEGFEAQWVSVDGSTVELVLWSGVLARPGVTRAALVMRDGVRHERTAVGDAVDAEVRELGAFVHEPAGSVIRAHLIGDVARELDAGMLAERVAYLTGDAALTSPFVQSFRVRERLPADVARLSKALRERGIGTLEIKKRGVDIDPAALRPRLRLRGDAHATLILTRIDGARVAILADRV
ncbi:THUMP-like domain-containing protein [Microbacterium sp.]|uniref:class I SAM-dependent methyltransferase n=1 Tax=Microbacterium sp. TaxID=51671 RepID=UPI003A87B35B